ncbi:protocadherin Fat 4-like [Candoia aspera]|uniref:protocadherin Fat 4-like n=1 Tax=Candoia aspera TaxID=51853 RepID=UPI002FD7B18D
MEQCIRRKQGMYLFLLLCLPGSLCISIYYSMPEETKSGSKVANVLKDLKLGIQEFFDRRAHLAPESTKQHFSLDIHTGDILINDKIDRDVLCSQTDSCILTSQIVLDNPLESYNIEIQIEDINDNAPKFSKNEFEIEIPENVPASMAFPLESAHDEDLGENSIQNYTLSSNEYFWLDVQRNKDGINNVDLVLKRPLDREKMPHLNLTLTAVDGGVPQKTGTVQINIDVLDNNDNSPQFLQSEYKVRIKENLPKGTEVAKVEATDLDFGSNAQILYSFHRVPERINDLFLLNERTGEITIWGQIDYEKEKRYSMNIRATDGGGLSGRTKILIEIEDVNDNPPEVSIISLTSILKEDSPLEKVVALFSVRDQDSGDNSKTVCSVEMNLPFVLKATTNNFYQLVLQSPLDRETLAEYNITITAIDWGSPRLTSTRMINIQISDVNDNPPLFGKSLYDMQIRENNIPGLLIGSVHAVDLDTKLNAKVTYSLLPEKGDVLVPSSISVNSETGNVYALRSLDYEQIRDFRVTVRATDGGSPSLSSEVIVRIIVIDENDNAPFFLYPLQNSTSPCNELVPKSAEAGYLVTKVVAVDGDSGQNAWLSYELLKATDPALFSIGAQNGEVKARRALNERDTNKQRLVILVRDNGLPPQTSTASLNVLLVDGFWDPFLRRVDVSVQEPEGDKTLTTYLVICLAAVSFVFLFCIVVFIVVKVLKKDPQSNFSAAPPHFPPAGADTPENYADSQNGSLSRAYRYDVCLTGGSLSSEFRFLRPFIPVFSVGDVNVPGIYKTSSCSRDIPKQGADKQLNEQLDVRTHADGSKYAELVLEKALDRETIPQITLILEAVDGGIPRRTGTVQIIIDILDANDNVPHFEQSVYKVQLVENSPPGSLVTKVAASDDDKGAYADITYTFSQVPGNVLKSFKLNNHTGEITLVGKIDYEENSNYELNIKASDGGGLSAYCKVLVDIKDENDNAPTITISSITNPLPENSLPETVVALFGVRDNDSGDNGRTTCDIDSNLPFMLKPTKNNYYQLVTHWPLDREQVSEYNITITATDQGSPRLTSMRIVHIQISDVNDNPPVFERSFYDFHLRENNIPGLLIGSVHAVDLDAEQNAQVTYLLFLGKIREGPVSSYISINSETGNLYAVRSIDYEDIQDFQVTVRAVDKGSPPLSSQTMVRVLITDENDNAPFILCPLQNSTSPSSDLVPRAAETGYLVTKVVAVDRDSGQNSWLSYQLLKATDPSLFTVGTQNGEVKTTRPVTNRDSFKHTLVVAVRDNGRPPQSVSATLRILLVDGFSDPYMKIMDNPKGEVPQEGDDTLTIMEQCIRRKQGMYLFLLLCLPGSLCISIYYSMPEETKSGSKVANVLKDLKLGIQEFFDRRAHLAPESTKQHFSLDIHTGDILINDKIDRDVLCSQTDSCILTSQIVLDNPLESYNIEIQIEDINDNAPKFSKNEFEIEIPENVPASMAFPLESAHDEDLGENSIQNYTLSSNEYFWLDVQRNKDGINNVDLVLKRPLDREKMPHLNLTLTAVDGGVPQKTGTVQINIDVLDINDNSPQFLQSEYKVRIKENLPKGTEVAKVEATDLDFGSNAQILYSFHRVPERINDLFLLNERTGEITIWGQIDYEKERSYSINIRATDGGGLSGHCKVLIDIEDMNDNPPEVSIISLTSILKENSPLEKVVALFSVRDQDSGDNSKTVCSMEMNLPFVLKATTNNFYQLVLQSPLDRETLAEYNITITAIDWGSPRLTSTRMINIQISDVNDNPPLFGKSLYDMQIRENNIPGLLIGSVHAVDLDTKLNAKVTYSLLPEKGDVLVPSSISVNSETGNVYALRSLDYEQIRDFRVTVRATDGGSPSLSSEVIVRIIVIDENDNAPFFLYPLQNSTSPCNELVPKLAEAGYLVTKVVAVDGDSGQNAWLSYELLKATDPALFSIGAQNGEVKARRALNERDTNKQRLVILVRDNGLPPQTSTASLNVLLVDGFSDPFLRRVDVSVQEPEGDKTLTTYLVICLAAVSFVFLFCIVVFIVVKVLKKDPQSTFSAAPPHFPPSGADTPENCADSQNGSLSRAYRYDVCLTGGSLSSEFRFLRPFIPVFSVGDVNVPGNYKTSSCSRDIPQQGADKQLNEQAAVVSSLHFSDLSSCILFQMPSTSV